MGLITAVLVFVGGLFAATLSKLIGDEVKAWLPTLAERLVRRAAAKLPMDQRERYLEEWLADLEQIPGDIGKFVVALGFQREAAKMVTALTDGDQRLWYNRLIDSSIACVFLLVFAPLMGAISLAVKLDGSGPILVRKHRIGPGGRTYTVLSFRSGGRGDHPDSTADGGKLSPTSLLDRLFEGRSWVELPYLLSVIKGDCPLHLWTIWRLWRRRMRGPRE